MFVTAAAHRLSSSESHLTDAVSLLSSIPHPTTDSLPKFREVISLLSQTEHLQVRALSFMPMIDKPYIYEHCIEHHLEHCVFVRTSCFRHYKMVSVFNESSSVCASSIPVRIFSTTPTACQTISLLCCAELIYMQTLAHRSIILYSSLGEFKFPYMTPQ